MTIPNSYLASKPRALHAMDSHVLQASPYTRHFNSSRTVKSPVYTGCHHRYIEWACPEFDVPSIPLPDSSTAILRCSVWSHPKAGRYLAPRWRQ
jgi:hypothetical protein